MTGRRTLLAAVRRTRRRALVLGGLRAACAAATGVVAGPLVSAAVLPWVPEPVGPWVAAGLLALGLVFGGWLAAVEWRRAAPRLSTVRAAELLAGSDPAARELLRTGADLAAWEEGGAEARGASAELVAAQVQQAGRASRASDPGRAVPLRSAAPSVLRLAGALVVFGAWLAADPGGSVAVWGRLVRGGVPEPVAVGNLELSYTPPAYTGLSERTVAGSDGAVEGYPGTRVTLAGKLSRPVDAGEWRGPGGQTVPLTVAGDAFRVSWILDRAGRYDLSFRRRDRAVPSDFSPRSIVLRADARPQVTLSAPEEDLEVTTDQEVEVTFEATDDFAVQRVELVLQGDREVRIPVPVEAGPTVRGRARFLPLRHPELGAGAHLRVEAWDGDAVSGPKAGASRSVYVTFLDKRRLLTEIGDLEDRLLEALLAHLADHLETGDDVPAATEAVARLRDRGRDLLRLFDQLAERVRVGADQGTLGSLAVLRMEEGLRGTLEPFLRGGGDRTGIVAELERDVLFLDRLLQSLRMEEALSLGDELAALQRGLFDELQAGGTPEDLLARVDELQRLLAQMAEKMSRSGSAMPDAFANADAVREMPANELQSALEELRRALERGDMDAARRLAEELLQTVSRWMAALEEAASGATREELDPALQELVDLEREVGELAAEQEGILQETQDVARAASERAIASLQEELESFLRRQEKRLQVIEESARLMEALGARPSFPAIGAPGAERDRPAPAPPGTLEALRRLGAAVAEVRGALRQDLGRARQSARALGEALAELERGVRQGLPREGARRRQAEHYAETADRELGALLQDLDGLAAQRARGLTPEEQAGLRELAGRQGRAAERAGGVAERLESLSGRTPLVEAGMGSKARDAQGAMGEARSELGRRDPFGATPPEGRALEHLAEIARGLESARQQMMQGMGGGGLQIVRSPGGRRPGGGRDVDRSPVEIPKEMEARELKAFREEVLKAMRSGRYPKDYEDDVEGYFERLIR